jgi:hypothetical protein
LRRVYASFLGTGPRARSSPSAWPPWMRVANPANEFRDRVEQHVLLAFGIFGVRADRSLRARGAETRKELRERLAVRSNPDAQLVGPRSET